MDHPTAFTSQLLKLPVVLTPKAWGLAVQWDEPNGADVTVLRLCTLLLKVYRELHLNPGQPETLLCYYPRIGQVSVLKNMRLELKITRIETPYAASYLCVSLRSESSLDRPLSGAQHD